MLVGCILLLFTRLDVNEKVLLTSWNIDREIDSVFLTNCMYAAVAWKVSGAMRVLYCRKLAASSSRGSRMVFILLTVQIHFLSYNSDNFHGHS